MSIFLSASVDGFLPLMSLSWSLHLYLSLYVSSSLLLSDNQRAGQAVSDMSIFLSATVGGEACEGCLCLTGSDILYDRLDSLVSQPLPKLKPKP